MTERSLVTIPAEKADKHAGTAEYLARYAARRYDRWENSKSGFGGGGDPMTQTGFQPGVLLNRGALDQIYEWDWISGKIIDIPPADATRKWLTPTHEDDPDRAEVARKELDRWNLRVHTEEAAKLARLYGGALIVFGAFDGSMMHEPLQLDRIRSVEFVHVVDRWMAYPLTFDADPGSNSFGDVETYNIQRVRVTGVQNEIVHASRVIRFEGRYMPPLRRLRNFGWQNPILVRLYEVIRQFGVSTQSLSATLQDHVIKKLKISNLQDLVAAGQWDVVSGRLANMAQEINMHGFAVYGADEEVEKMGTPIQQLPKLAEMFIDYVSAAADIPRSRLFQNMTGTLGGDPGKNDLRVHYDNIEALQENQYRKPVQRAINILLAPLGFEEDEIGFTWNPLWQMTDAEQAEIELKTAQKDEIYIRSGVVEPEEVAVSRFSGEVPDLRQMSIDVDRRQKALEDLKNVDLIQPEPTFQQQLEMQTSAALQLQGGEVPEDDDDPAGEREDAANVTSKDKDGAHAHTYDIDHMTGNGQTIDTLDDHEPHVHVIRAYRMSSGGADGHTHLLGTFGKIPLDLSKRE